nr:hypothetical protein [Tanacetum cinerariifolium]
MCDKWTYFFPDKFVDLNGEVGYMCAETMEIWILNHKKEWVPHCRFKEIVPDRVIIDVIGCWNKDEDILIRSIYGNPVGAFYVYKLKSGVLHKTNLAGSDACLGRWTESHVGLVLILPPNFEDGRCGQEVIWFDVNKEEFELIERPKCMCDKWTYSLHDKLVDLNGEVRYVYTKTMEVWLLNHKKEWVPHCRFKDIVPDRVIIDVIGCWNKDGDILIRSICGNPVGAFYVYNLKSGVLNKTNLAGSDACL